jgi:hypothetical protein
VFLLALARSPTAKELQRLLTLMADAGRDPGLTTKRKPAVSVF